MLYLDYSRKEGEWVPNEYGGREDLEAVAFLKELNEVAPRARARASISAAEESTAWPGVSRPTYVGGLGFGFKWNMGWMHDTLGYFQQRPDLPPLPPPRADVLADVRVQRELHPAAVARRGRARQGLAARRRCPATAGRSSRTCARCTRYMWAHPGKKLLFMGGEFAQERGVEPRALARLAPARGRRATRGVQSLVRDLNRVYRDEPALWERRLRRRAASAGSRPTTPTTTSSRSPARRADGERRRRLRRATSRRCRARATALGLPRAGRWREALNTDADALRRLGRRQPRRRRGRGRRRGTASRTRPSSRCRRSASSGSCPRSARRRRSRRGRRRRSSATFVDAVGPDIGPCASTAGLPRQYRGWVWRLVDVSGTWLCRITGTYSEMWRALCSARSSLFAVTAAATLAVAAGLANAACPMQYAETNTMMFETMTADREREAVVAAEVHLGH